jgi:hypothetical protein
MCPEVEWKFIRYPVDKYNIIFVQVYPNPFSPNEGLPLHACSTNSATALIKNAKYP